MASPDIDVDVILKSLGSQIAQLTIELAVARAQIAAMEAQPDADHQVP